jgi:ankyrin repeat protein
MKRKHKQKKAKKRESNTGYAVYKRHLLGKNVWNIVHSFIFLKNEKKFNEIHKSLSQFFTKYENVSDQIKKRLGEKSAKWLFFKHFETNEIFAEKVTERTKQGQTVLHLAAQMDEMEIAQAVIGAGVDIDAISGAIDGMNALHIAALMNYMKIGQVNVKWNPDWGSGRTAREIAVLQNYKEFAEMLHKKTYKLNKFPNNKSQKSY